MKGFQTPGPPGRVVAGPEGGLITDRLDGGIVALAVTETPARPLTPRSRLRAVWV